MKKNIITLGFTAILFTLTSFLSLNAATNDDSKAKQAYESKNVVVENSTKFPIILHVGQGKYFEVKPNNQYEKLPLPFPIGGKDNPSIEIEIEELDENATKIAEVKDLQIRKSKVNFDWAKGNPHSETIEFPASSGTKLKIKVEFRFDKKNDQMYIKLTPA